MRKVIVLIAGAVIFLAGFVMTVMSIPGGVIVLLAGLLMAMAAGIFMITAGGSRTMGFFNLRPQRGSEPRVELPNGQPVNIWDEITADKPKKDE